MKKKLFKAIAGCAAVCFVSGMIVSVNSNKAVADDNYICNYDFEDGVVSDDLNVKTVTLKVLPEATA